MTTIDQEAAKKCAAQECAAQVQSLQQALEALVRDQGAFQIAEIRKHIDHLVALAQQAQVLVF